MAAVAAWRHIHLSNPLSLARSSWPPSLHLPPTRFLNPPSTATLTPGQTDVNTSSSVCGSEDLQRSAHPLTLSLLQHKQTHCTEFVLYTMFICRFHSAQHYCDSYVHVRVGFPCWSRLSWSSFCIRLQLKFLFIQVESAVYFLHQSTDCLLCGNSYNDEKCRHSEPEAKVTPFVQTAVQSST